MKLNVTLTLSNPVELSNFMALEQHPEAAEFVTQNSLKEHMDAFFKPDITYLTIEKDGIPVGYMLLAHDPDGVSVELRRIVVENKESGVGQASMKLLEGYVKHVIGRPRLWLDVFTTNPRAIHVYQKLGYTQFGTDIYKDGRPLLLFEKQVG